MSALYGVLKVAPGFAGSAKNSLGDLWEGLGRVENKGAPFINL